MGRSVYDKSTKDLKLGLLNLDKKLTNYTNEEIKKVAGEINQRITIVKGNCHNSPSPILLLYLERISEI